MSRVVHTLCLFITVVGLSSLESRGAVRSLGGNAFAVEQKVLLPAPRTAVYDAMTGDISEWWDHSFSEKPYQLMIEPKPGGRFLELFNAQGDGALHATVIYADRGKILRFNGPLGLSGRAVTMVTTLSFEEHSPDSTQLSLSIHVAGEIDDQTAHLVDNVWHHFLVERFTPYVLSGRYKNTIGKSELRR